MMIGAKETIFPGLKWWRKEQFCRGLGRFLVGLLLATDLHRVGAASANYDRYALPTLNPPLGSRAGAHLSGGVYVGPRGQLQPRTNYPYLPSYWPGRHGLVEGPVEGLVPRGLPRYPPPSPPPARERPPRLIVFNPSAVPGAIPLASPLLPSSYVPPTLPTTLPTTWSTTLPPPLVRTSAPLPPPFVPPPPPAPAPDSTVIEIPPRPTPPAPPPPQSSVAEDLRDLEDALGHYLPGAKLHWKEALAGLLLPSALCYSIPAFANLISGTACGTQVMSLRAIYALTNNAYAQYSNAGFYISDVIIPWAVLYIGLSLNQIGLDTAKSWFHHPEAITNPKYPWLRYGLMGVNIAASTIMAVIPVFILRQIFITVYNIPQQRKVAQYVCLALAEFVINWAALTPLMHRLHATLAGETSAPQVRLAREELGRSAERAHSWFFHSTELEIEEIWLKIAEASNNLERLSLLLRKGHDNAPITIHPFQRYFPTIATLLTLPFAALGDAWLLSLAYSTGLASLLGITNPELIKVFSAAGWMVGLLSSPLMTASPLAIYFDWVISLFTGKTRNPYPLNSYRGVTTFLAICSILYAIPWAFPQVISYYQAMTNFPALIEANGYIQFLSPTVTPTDSTSATPSFSTPLPITPLPTSTPLTASPLATVTPQSLFPLEFLLFPAQSLQFLLDYKTFPLVAIYWLNYTIQNAQAFVIINRAPYLVVDGFFYVSSFLARIYYWLYANCMRSIFSRESSAPSLPSHRLNSRRKRDALVRATDKAGELMGRLPDAAIVSLHTRIFPEHKEHVAQGCPSKWERLKKGIKDFVKKNFEYILQGFLPYDEIDEAGHGEEKESRESA